MDMYACVVTSVGDTAQTLALVGYALVGEAQHIFSDAARPVRNGT